MKLKLQNFRCHANTEFEFGKNGITLISGKSGAGKTSLLSAIYFALFGIGTKVVSYGKTSCRVELQFGDMKIIRTKRPNHLTLNDVHEDEAAQHIINEKLGDTFETTSYVSQNSKNSFIMMSPIDKLRFLEKFAFSETNLPQIKKRCKDLIKERNENLIKITASIDLATSMIQELEKPTPVPFPIKCSEKNREKHSKNEYIRHRNSITLLTRCQKKIDSSKSELEAIRLLNAKLESRTETLSRLENKLKTLKKQKIDLEKNYKGDSKLEKLEDKLSLLSTVRELEMLTHRYDQDSDRLDKMKEQEKEELDNKVSELLQINWKEYTKEEVRENISEIKDILADVEQLEKYKQQIEGVNIDEKTIDRNKKSLEVKQQLYSEKEKYISKLEIERKILTCPSCEANLHLTDDGLEIYDDVVESKEGKIDEEIEITQELLSNLDREISKLKSTLKRDEIKLSKFNDLKQKIKDIEDSYQEELPSKTELKRDLEYMTEYNIAQKEIKKQINELETKIKEKKFSSSLETLEKSLKRQNEKITELKRITKHFNIKNEESLRTQVREQRIYKEKLSSVSSEIETLTSDKITCEEQILSFEETHIQKFGKVREEEVVKTILEKKKKELEELEEKKELHTLNLKKIQEYDEYKKKENVYSSWEKKLEKLAKDEEVCRKKYAGATLLQEKILEAESIAIWNVISKINTHAQMYLDKFFPEDPITINLLPFKENNKGKSKPQINLQIDYKSMECDLAMLSGGELSRVILAFALALGEMFNTPLFLLDECTASLDQELTGTVVDGIREYMGDKLVLVIAHQVVKGEFDRVINM